MVSQVDLTGYHLTFDAEMTSSADMAKFANTFQNGNRTLYNNHEAQAYANYNPSDPSNPYSFANGALTITAKPVPYSGQPYTSGLLQTSGSFTQNEGYFEIRAQTPDTHGFWSAFWMLAPNAGTPELDIMEQPSNAGDSSYWTFINTPTDHSGGFTNVGVDLSPGYHTYGLLWTAKTIQFTFDGQLIGTPHDTPPALVGQEMYLLANLAVGDPAAWPGQPANGASANYDIDYIRAYSNDPSRPAVAVQAISSPDGANTTPSLGSVTVPMPVPAEPAPVVTPPVVTTQVPGTTPPPAVEQPAAAPPVAAPSPAAPPPAAPPPAVEQPVAALPPAAPPPAAPPPAAPPPAVEQPVAAPPPAASSPPAMAPPAVEQPVAAPPVVVQPGGSTGGGNFIIANQTTGQQAVAAGVAYTGPVSGLEREFILVTPDNVNITAQVPNVFIHSGSGTGVLDVSKSNGNNVLDGGSGSNFLTGGTGFDTFFLDYRNPTVDLFSTIVNFHSGDNLTIFGINQTDYMLKLLDNQGAANAKGLDFAVDAAGKPHGNVVLAGFSNADIASGKLTLSYGRTQDLPGLPGSEYLNIHGN
jgi:beta-glucanase (GH16 family)